MPFCTSERLPGSAAALAFIASHSAAIIGEPGIVMVEVICDVRGEGGINIARCHRFKEGDDLAARLFGGCFVHRPHPI